MDQAIKVKPDCLGLEFLIWSLGILITEWQWCFLLRNKVWITVVLLDLVACIAVLLTPSLKSSLDPLTLMPLVANLAITKRCKNPEKWLKPDTIALIWEVSAARAIQWIPTQQGLDGFQKSLRPCALDESSLSIGRVKVSLCLSQRCASHILSLSVPDLCRNQYC